MPFGCKSRAYLSRHAALKNLVTLHRSGVQLLTGSPSQNPTYMTQAGPIMLMPSTGKQSEQACLQRMAMLSDFVTDPLGHGLEEQPGT